VARQYRRQPQDNPVDYALFLMRTPRLFVEAKSLDKNLREHKWRMQTLTYATATGVEWCVLTNGDQYHLYNSHGKGDLDEKLFRAVSVSEQSEEENLLDTLDLLSKGQMEENRINVLWKAHFVDSRVKSVLKDFFSSQDAGLIRLIRKRLDELGAADIRDSLKRAEIKVEFPILNTLGQTKTRGCIHDPREHGSGPEETTRAPVILGVAISDLINAGMLTTPLHLQKKYKGKLLEAEIIQDGSVIFDGKSYDSLSTSAGMARNTVIGVPPDGRPLHQTNGWIFWQFQDADTGKLEFLDVLRQRYLNNRK